MEMQLHKQRLIKPLVVAVACGMLSACGSFKKQASKAVPTAKAAGVGQLYKVSYELQVSSNELDCLAKNVYFEAAHDHKARLSVAQVTMNRLQSLQWGKDVCAVVFARKQFSWTQNQERAVTDAKRWKAALQASEAYLRGVRVKGLERSLHYHADYLTVRAWAKGMKVVLQTGGHIFFEENS